MRTLAPTYTANATTKATHGARRGSASVRQPDVAPRLPAATMTLAASAPAHTNSAAGPVQASRPRGTGNGNQGTMTAAVANSGHASSSSRRRTAARATASPTAAARVHQGGSRPIRPADGNAANVRTPKEHQAASPAHAAAAPVTQVKRRGRMTAIVPLDQRSSA